MLPTWDNNAKQGIFKICHMPTPDRQADDRVRAMNDTQLHKIKVNKAFLFSFFIQVVEFFLNVLQKVNYYAIIFRQT